MRISGVAGFLALSVAQSFGLSFAQKQRRHLAALFQDHTQFQDHSLFEDHTLMLAALRHGFNHHLASGIHTQALLLLFF